MEMGAPGQVESRYWKSGHRLGLMSSLELDWGQHAQPRVTALAVVEDPEVLKDRIRELDPCPPRLAVQEPTRIRLQNDSIIALSKQLPTAPKGGARPGREEPRSWRGCPCAPGGSAL